MLSALFLFLNIYKSVRRFPSGDKCSRSRHRARWKPWKLYDWRMAERTPGKASMPTRAIHGPRGCSQSPESTPSSRFLGSPKAKQTAAWTTDQRPATSDQLAHRLGNPHSTKFGIIHSTDHTALECLQCSENAPAHIPQRNMLGPQNESAPTEAVTH